MKRPKQKRPTTRELKKEIGVLVHEVFNLKNYVDKVLSPLVQTNMTMFENYLSYKGDLDNYITHIEKEVNNEKRIKDKSSKKGKTEQAKGGGTSKTVSKDG